MKDEQILKLLRSSPKRAFSFEELLAALKIDKNNHRNLRKTLRRLIRAGQIADFKNKFRLSQVTDQIEGIVSKHARGFAFVTQSNRNKEDVFLNRREARTLMDGDKVLVVEREGKGDKKQGTLIKILERGSKKIVGTFSVIDRHFYVLPHGSSKLEMQTESMYVSQKNSKGAKGGDVVVAEITKYPDRNRGVEGRVVEILGREGDSRIDTDIILHKYDLPLEFPKKVKEESAKIPTSIDPTEIKQRVDLRALPFVTIDGENAKDFDDAVCVKREKDGYRLWVSIADVSYYVQDGSLIDHEAWNRGTSIYFPDRVVPMLPEELSNEICSLKPNVDRLTYTVEMFFDNQGKRKGVDLYESVINSCHRLTYTEVWKMIEKDKDTIKRYEKYYPNLLPAIDLFRLLKKEKSSRGSLDFDLPESQIILDATGKIDQIVKYPRNDAHMLIEEFMIAANEAVAEKLEASLTPGIYRIHEPPANEAFQVFKELLHNLGLSIQVGKGKIRPIQLSSIIKKVAGKPQEKLINTVLLRSLKQAIYSSENLGHFGLASSAYSHFTSPIRRYPDLILHRLLKNLKKTQQLSDKKSGELLAKIDSTAAQSSKKERSAMEAEREVVGLKKCMFMKDKVGEQYSGFVAGIADFGLFIELEEWFIEGLIPFSTLKDDEYNFIQEHYLARGKRNKREFRLGDKVKIKVEDVRIDQREIDFSLI